MLGHMVYVTSVCAIGSSVPIHWLNSGEGEGWQPPPYPFKPAYSPFVLKIQFINPLALQW